MAQKDCLDTFIHEIRTIVLGVSPARVAQRQIAMNIQSFNG